MTLTELKMMPAITALNEEGCIYLQDGKCAVYAERPFRCRLYGPADIGLFHCSDCKPDKPLSDQDAKRLLDEYEFIVSGDLRAGTALKEAQ